MSFRNLSVLAITTLVLACAAPAGAGGAVGEKADGFTLTSASGEEISLADYAGKTVVLEWINPNCPFSDRHAREKTMTRLEHQHGEVVWLAVNSTNPKSGDYLQPSEHLAWNRERGIDYPVLYDPSGTVGHAYGAKTTPHMYIIDGSGTLLYNGAIDDDRSGRRDPSERTNYVDLGLTALAGGGRPDPATTKPYGCTVKY